MALGFARLTAETSVAGRRILAAVRQHPFMVAGTGGFDTTMMQAVPRVFVKVGAEGVYCGCIPHARIGIALKCDDGSARAAQVAVASVLASLDLWTPVERATLHGFARSAMTNWRQIHVGDILGV
jgi:L-asparaginase II